MYVTHLLTGMYFFYSYPKLLKLLKVDAATVAVGSSDNEDRDKSISHDDGDAKKKKKRVGFRDRKVIKSLMVFLCACN